VGLYVATTGFVLVVRRWPVFDRHVVGIYGLGEGVSLPLALALVVAVYTPGEELFWRGLVQGELGSALSSASGAILAWLGYVAAETTSGSLAIVAAAVVAGGAWTVLASWSGGVLAGAVSHALWTGAMLTMPPGGTGGRGLPDAAATDTGGPVSP
jgi:membrane protease YdiL (CAAX protease family)